MRLEHHFQGQKVKGQGHQAALLTAAFTHEAAAAVTVGTYSPWEPTATLPSAGAAVGSAAPTKGGEVRSISWRPPAYSLLYLLHNEAMIREAVVGDMETRISVNKWSYN